MSHKPVFWMKPDISLMDKEENILRIADAKWKILDEKKSDLGITQSDLYQMESYASRYGVKSPRAGLSDAEETDKAGPG